MTGSSARDIRHLVHTYCAQSMETFAAATASNRTLAEYGLPERPDARAEPEQFAVWEAMLRPGTEVVRPIFPWDVQTVALAATPVSRRGSPPLIFHGFDHIETSRNWSGAYITPLPRSDRFFAVLGAWRVPSPTAPAVPPAGVDPCNVEYRSATWIGVGGHRSYHSLPQIGTSQSIVIRDGVPREEFKAWWQWWIKDRPGHDSPIEIANFDIQAGDEILAMLSVEAPWPGDVRFNLKNQRTNKLAAFKVRAPADILPLGFSAEWVHERSSSNNALYPLPRCSDVRFRHCLALRAADFGEPLAMQRLGGNARLVRMSETFDNPRRSALVSCPERKGPCELDVVYREAGG